MIPEQVDTAQAPLSSQIPPPRRTRRAKPRTHRALLVLVVVGAIVFSLSMNVVGLLGLRNLKSETVNLQHQITEISRAVDET